MTDEETKAIKSMQRAIKAAHKLGIRLAGMDGNLLYATASAYQIGLEIIEELKRDERTRGHYCAVAHAVQLGDVDGADTLDSDCYEDSGGY